MPRNPMKLSLRPAVEKVLFNPLPNISERELVAMDRKVVRYEGRRPLDTPAFRLSLEFWDNGLQQVYFLSPGEEVRYPQVMAERLYEQQAERGLVMYDPSCPEDERERLALEGLQRAREFYYTLGEGDLQTVAVRYGQSWDEIKYRLFPDRQVHALRATALADAVANFDKEEDEDEVVSAVSNVRR